MAVAVTRPRAQGYGALIGDDYFRLALDGNQPLAIYTRDSLAARQDQKGSAGENVLEIGYAFSRANLTGGEGLDWWPRVVGETPSATDDIRFWSSAGFDIRRPESGQPYSLRLVRDFGLFATPGSTPVDMGFSNDAVYVANGQDIDRYDDWADATVDNNQDIGVNIANIDVGLDDTVIVTDTTGDIWIKPSKSDVFVKVYNAPTDGAAAVAAWWVKGRIIASAVDTASPANSVMREIAPGIGGTLAAPTVSPTFTTVDTFQGTLNSVVDAGHAIVAAVSDGSLRSYVPQTDTAGGAPVLTIRARTQVPVGENPYALGYSLGQLLVFTHATTPSGASATARMYTGTVLDERFDYSVGGLQLVRVWLDSKETAPNYVKNIVARRDEIFFVIAEDSNDYNVWRYDLVTQGIFRHYDSTFTSSKGLVFFDERLAVIVGSGVQLESTTAYVPSAYLITPNITFGLNTPISWLAFVLESFGLGGGGVKVELYRTTVPTAILDPNHPGWILVETYTDPSQSGLEKALVNVTGNQLALQIKAFASSDLAQSPDIQRFAVRGLPQHRDWIIDIPINVSDYVTAPGRMPIRIPGIGDRTHRRIIELQGASITCQVYDPPITIRGIVETIAEPVLYMSDRGSQGRLCMTRVLGKVIGTQVDSAVQGNAGMGIGPMGITTMGIGEI